MIVDYKFGSNCDRHSYQTTGRRRRGVGAPPPSLRPCRLGDHGDDGDRGSGGHRLDRAGDGGPYASAGMPVNLRGLSIVDVRATVMQQTEGPGELLVTGEIANLRDRETVRAESAPGSARRGWARALRLDGAGSEVSPRRS